MKRSSPFVVSIVTATAIAFFDSSSSLSTVLAYTPSIPNRSVETIKDLDMSSILTKKSTKESINVARVHQDSMKNVSKTRSTQSKASTSSPIDISSVLAEAEAALQAAGINDELDVVSDLLAESIEESKGKVKKLVNEDNQQRSPSLSHLLLEATTYAVKAVGFAAMTFTKEQLRPDSELSSFAKGIAEVVKAKATQHIDLSNLEQQGKDSLLRISENALKHSMKVFNKAQNESRGIKNFLHDMFQSPYEKLWEKLTQNEQTMGDTEVVVPNHRHYFMTEKKERLLHPFETSSFEVGSSDAKKKTSPVLTLATQLIYAYRVYCVNGDTAVPPIEVGDSRSPSSPTIAPKIVVKTNEKRKAIPYFSQVETTQNSESKHI